MKTKYSLHLFSLIICGLSVLPLFGQENVVKKVMACNSSTVFAIDNKYGDIDIRDWNQSKIEIEATIKLIDIPKDKAEQILQYVDINIYEDADTVRVETLYDDAFFESIGDAKVPNENKFEVNYVVMMPPNLKLRANNKYGNIFISKLTSASDIDLKYGNLKINQLQAKNKSNMAKIKLSYSKATIESCEWVKMTSKYSKINIQKSKALIVVSKYSKLNIEEGSTLITESKYDQYEIGTIDNFVVSSEYSDYKIEKVNNKINLETRYTDVKVGTVSAGFELIDIKNMYGSINLGITSGASYHIDGNAKYTKIHYPESDNVSRLEKNNQMNVKGVVGNSNSTKGEVSITTSYGSVRLD